jgi:pectate lyase
MRQILDLLTTYADTILKKYRDPYHGTPLFFDGFDSFTGRPVTWRNVDGTDWEPSNLASQQNFFRLLTALTNLTGREDYKQAAMDAIKWHFRNADSSGLLHWGGHVLIDLKTLRPVGPEDKHMFHELKHHYPFYELMHEVNPIATTRLIQAIWNAHILDWNTMELSRHGNFGGAFDEDGFWNRPQNRNLEILREAKGLSFVNIGTDLIYAASMLYKTQTDEQAVSWAEFLAWQYVRSRHPKTGLGAYQFNRPEKREDPPSSENAPNYTFSYFGDRAQRQFGPEYGEVAKEAWVLFKMDEEMLNGPEGIYGDSAFAQTSMARELGDRGKTMLNWTLDGLEAWAKYAYVPETNEIKPMFADGRDLTGEVFKRFGYYGPKGTVFERKPITGMVFLSFATAWAVSRRDTLWPTVCAMARNFGLGEWNASNPTKSNINRTPPTSNALLLFAVLEVYHATQAKPYLELAQALGEVLVQQRAHRGVFVPSEHHVYCRLDDAEPLALAALVAAVQGKPELVPAFRSQGGYIHGDALMPDGKKKNIQDVKVIYSRKAA